MSEHVDLIARYTDDGGVVVEPGSDTQWFSCQLLANANDDYLQVTNGRIVITAENGTFTYLIDAVEDMSGSGSFAVRAYRIDR